MRVLSRLAALREPQLSVNQTSDCAFHFGSFSHEAVQVEAHEDQPLWVDIPPMIPAEVNQANTVSVRYQYNRTQDIEITDLRLTVSGESTLEGHTEFTLDNAADELTIPLTISHVGFQLITFTLSGTLHRPEHDSETFELQSRTTVLAR